MWAYMALLTSGVVYTFWRAASFLPALRQAQFEFGPILATGSTAAYAPFFNDIVAKWPSLLAAHPATVETAVSMGVMTAMLMLAFRALIKRPGAVPAEMELGGKPMALARLQDARALAGFSGRVKVNKDPAAEQCYSDSKAIYLTRVHIQWLSKLRDGNNARKIAFVLRHEMMHSNSSDNLLWTWGMALNVFLTGLVGMFLIEPVLFAAIMVMPNHWVTVLPTPLIYVMILLITCFALAVVSTAQSGLVPNLTAAREYFADRAAGLTVGVDALPYNRSCDPMALGDRQEPWQSGAQPPDRRLYALGISPRVTALAASAIAMWTIVRTVMLTLAWDRAADLTLPLDGGCLVAVSAMLWALPRRVRKVRDYGALPWLVTFGLLALISAIFAVMRAFFSEFDMVPIVGFGFIAWVGLPPLVASLATLFILAWRRSPPPTCPGLLEIDHIAPRRPQLSRLAWLLVAIPGYLASYLFVGGALFVGAGSFPDWALHVPSTWMSLAVNLGVLLVCTCLVILFARNLSSPLWHTALLEQGLIAVAVGLIAYVLLIMMPMVTAAPQPDSGPPIDYLEVIRRMGTLPSDAVAIAVVVMLVAGVAGIPFWWARCRLFAKPH
jgi:hypothetical protein